MPYQINLMNYIERALNRLIQVLYKTITIILLHRGFTLITPGPFPAWAAVTCSRDVITG